MAILSVVVPTVVGRESHLERTICSYEEHTRVEIEWLVVHDRPTCGLAWNEGAALATGEYLHITADDLEPDGFDWLRVAVETTDHWGVPLGRVREGSETFGRDFCRVPFCRREWWRDVPADMHYYTDNAFTELMIERGHVPTVAVGYDFNHRRAMVGRGAGMTEMERMEHDNRAYLQWRLTRPSTSTSATG